MPTHTTARSSAEGIPSDEEAGASRWRVAAVLAAAAFVLYLGTASERWNADGIGLFVFHHESRGEQYHHVLFLPAARLFAFVVPWLDSEWQLRTMNAAASAGCVAVTFLVATRLGVRRASAAFASAALALSPALWMAGTDIEVHALHALATAVTALAVLGAARKGPVLATAVAAVGLAAIFGTHSSGVVLGPGLVVWVGVACHVARRPVSVSRLLAGVGPALLGVLLVAKASANAYRFGELSLGSDETMQYLDRWQSHGDPVRSLVGEWLLPSGLLLVLGALGAVVGGRRAARVGLLGLVLPSFAFFLWYGITENGGFALPSLCFLAVLGALALERVPPRAHLAAGVVLLVAQAMFGGARVVERNSGYRLDERLEQVRAALPEGGTLFAINRNRNESPLVDYFVDDVRELRVQGYLLDAARSGKSGAEAAEIVLGMIAAAEPDGGLAFDLAFTRPPPGGAPEALVEYTSALLGAIEARYETRTLPHEDWPMLVLEPRR